MANNKLLPIIKNPKYYEDFKNNERAAGQRKDKAWGEREGIGDQLRGIYEDTTITPARRKVIVPPLEARRSALQKEINKWDNEIKKNQKLAKENFLNRKTPQGKKWAQEQVNKKSVIKTGISIMNAVFEVQKVRVKGKGR